MKEQINLAKHLLIKRASEINSLLSYKGAMSRQYLANEIRHKRSEMFMVINEVKTLFSIELKIPYK